MSTTGQGLNDATTIKIPGAGNSNVLTLHLGKNAYQVPFAVAVDGTQVAPSWPSRPSN